MQFLNGLYGNDIFVQSLRMDKTIFVSSYLYNMNDIMSPQIRAIIITGNKRVTDKLISEANILISNYGYTPHIPVGRMGNAEVLYRPLLSKSQKVLSMSNLSQLGISYTTSNSSGVIVPNETLIIEV